MHMYDWLPCCSLDLRQAIAMLKALGAARAMELFKDIEEKKEQVRVLA